MDSIKTRRCPIVLGDGHPYHCPINIRALASQDEVLRERKWVSERKLDLQTAMK